MKNGSYISKQIKALLGMTIKRTDPVQWRFTVKKGTYNIYKVHITGFIVHPYRLPTSHKPTEGMGGPLPTAIEFEDNAFILLGDGLQEMGQVRREFNTTYNTEIAYYTNIVNYVKEVHVFNTPHTLKGRILYMPHTEKKCLELMEQPFEIPLT